VVVLKYEFGEVDEAMFQGDERPCENIFWILSIQTSALVEVAQEIFQVDEWPENS
jgi:hypothetical protein